MVCTEKRLALRAYLTNRVSPLRYLPHLLRHSLGGSFCWTTGDHRTALPNYPRITVRGFRSEALNACACSGPLNNLSRASDKILYRE